MDRSKKSALMFPHLMIVCAVVAAASLPAPAFSIAASTRESSPAAGFSAASLSPMLAQDEGIPDEDAVPTGQVDKYIAVYSAMQKNHSLSVEQAASKQGLTVDEFRTLEDKIERNPIVHQRVLDALKASTSSAKTAGSGAGKTR